MGCQPHRPKQPQKTLKEIIKENVKQVNKRRRQFQRETKKLQMNDKKMNKELNKLIEKKQPLKTLAQNILKNQKMIAKYKSMDEQLQNTIFQLQQMVTMQQMKNVMTGMAKIMGGTKDKFKMQQFQKSMKIFACEKQRMQITNEMVQDGMDIDEQIDDQAVNNLVRDKQNQFTHKKMMQNANEGEQIIEEDI